jgi:hypothetical protein
MDPDLLNGKAPVENVICGCSAAVIGLDADIWSEFARGQIIAGIHYTSAEEENRLATKELALELAAWDEAIRLASKKFERCP